MEPLILITNDDGFAAKGIRTLEQVAMEFGEVVVMAPGCNSSGRGHSITTDRPLRVREIQNEERMKKYACNGTPVDCVKLATEHFCPRRPALVLSGINHGSNSSINVLYSGTLGAVMEATALGFAAIGFSFLSHNPKADLSVCIPYARHIIGQVLEHGLPEDVALNVNIPRLEDKDIKGIRVCHQAKAKWLDSFEKRIDPRGVPYWWLTGKFVCDNAPETSDEWALANGYVSVVPISPDFTHYNSIDPLKQLLQ